MATAPTHRPPSIYSCGWRRSGFRHKMATLSINGHTLTATPALSRFDHAESAGIRVPTSCRKQGKCKECMVEIVEGMELPHAAH